MCTGRDSEKGVSTASESAGRIGLCSVLRPTNTV